MNGVDGGARPLRNEKKKKNTEREYWNYCVVTDGPKDRLVLGWS